MKKQLEEDRCWEVEAERVQTKKMLVYTYKGSITLFVPGMDRPFWCNADEAVRVARALLEAAKHRRAYDAQQRRRR